MFVDPLKDNEQNSTCLIKLLMIVAVRLGHVAGTTLDEIPCETVLRPDRTVQWTRPDWPIISQMPNGARFPVKGPIPSKILQEFLANIISEMSLLPIPAEQT